MLSTMQDRPLTINDIFNHSRQVHADSEVVTFMGDDCRRAWVFGMNRAWAKARRFERGLRGL